MKKNPALLEYCERALAEVERADLTQMDEWYSGLGDHVKNELEEGFKLNISGITTKEQATFFRGLELQIKFFDWYNTHPNGVWRAPDGVGYPSAALASQPAPEPPVTRGPATTKSAITTPPQTPIATPLPKLRNHGRGPVRRQVQPVPNSCWDPYYRGYYAC